MATSNLSELSKTMKDSNAPITVNVIAEPEKEVINTITKGDSEMVKVLNNILQILNQQLSFDRETENRRRLEEHLKPKDYQENIVPETVTKEGGEGTGGDSGLGLLGGIGLLLKAFWDGLKSGIGLLKQFGATLIEITGIKKLFGALSESLGGLIPKLGEFFMRMSPLLMRFTGLAGVIATLLIGLEKFGAWFRDFVGLPSIQNDAFNMKNYTGESQPSNRPMNMDEFEQERIPKNLGGESARRIDRPASEQPMSQEEFENQRIPKSKEKLNIKGKGVAKYLEETDAANLQKTMGISKEQYDVFRGSVAKIESPSYSKKGGSSGRFSGAYQMGADEIKDSAKALGIAAPSREEFLANPQLQEKLFDKYTEGHHKQLMKNEKYASMSKEEQLKVLGYAHNQGAGGASKWLKTGVAGKDAFGTAGTKYYEAIGENLSSLKKGELKIDYSNKESPVQQTASKVSKDTKESTRMSSAGLDQEKVNMVDASELRVKGGLKGQAFKGGETEEGTLNLARVLQAQEKNIPGGLNRFSSFNDEYHKHANPKSKHTKGLALDFSLKDAKQSSEASDYVKQQLSDSGLSEKDFKIINEYKNPSKHATGGHIHVNFANKEAAEKYAQFTKGGQTPSYAKIDEKQLPEGGKYKEEESEMEEMDEPTLSEKELLDRKPITIDGKTYKPNEEGYDEARKTAESKIREVIRQEKDSKVDSKLVTDTKDSKLVTDKQVDSGYKNYFEDLVSHLEKMVSFTEEIKDTNKKIADKETEKQSDTAKKEESKEEQPTAKQDKEAQKTMDDLFGPEEQTASKQESEKERTLSTEKQNQQSPGIFGGLFDGMFGGNKGIMGGPPNPYGQQPAGGFGGTFGQGQNPFGTIQQVLGTVGSTVSMGQQMGNMGKYGMGGGTIGGIGAAQGAIGGIQGVLGQMGQNSPMLGGMGQVLSSVGGIAGSIERTKNMGSIGGGGILGGINAASGAVGAAGNIFNAIGGIGGAMKGVGTSIGKGLSNMFGSDEPEGEKIEWHPISEKASKAESPDTSVSSMGPGDDIAAVKARQTSSSEEETDSGTSEYHSKEGAYYKLHGTQIGGAKDIFSDQSASLMPSLKNDGMSLESTTQSVQTGKEEMMAPSEPTIINAGGGGGGSGGGGGGGGGNSQSNPSSAGVMGVDIGVRNEEATLLRAQFGSVRVV